MDWGDGSAPESFFGPSGTQAGHAFESVGTFEIHVTATDKDGGVSAVASQVATILATEVQGSSLSIGGTGEDDLFVVTPSGTSVTLALNGVSLGTVKPPVGGLIFYAGQGNDQVTINGTSAADLFKAGLDWVDRGATRTSGEDVEVWQVNGLDGNDSLTALAGTAAFDGGTGTDSVTGPNVANEWLISGANAGEVNGLSFSNVETLLGGSAADYFSFVGTGSLSGRINGGVGTDSLDYRAWPTAVNVNLTTSSATGVSAIYSIESFFGSTASDTFTAPSSNNVWRITGWNAGVTAGTSFSGFEFLNGGAGSDTITLADPAAGVSGQIDGGLGSDMLIGVDSDGSWQISSLGGGKHKDSKTGAELPFAGIENLLGGSAADSFAFSGDGAIVGLVDGKSGVDSLDYSQLAGPITVDFQARTAPRLGSFAWIESLSASAAAGDTLIGPNAATVWSITGSNAGTMGPTAFSGFEFLTGGTGSDTFKLANPAAGISGGIDGAAGTDTLIGAAADSSWQIGNPDSGRRTDSQSGAALTFVSIENLTGGSLADYFQFATTGRVSGTLNGGSGTNGLSYETWTAAVSVNLQTGVASAVTGLVSNITMVLGGAGDDSLTSSTSRGAVLVGNGGNDILAGGGARDLLIGGDGSDVLSGGGADDLLIAGRTAFDRNSIALAAIFAEWANTTRDYATRVANLRGTGTGTRLNGDYFLQSSLSVFSGSGAGDQLTGGTERDWFFAELDDVLADQATSGSNAEYVERL